MWARKYDQEYKDMIVELFKSGMSLADVLYSTADGKLTLDAQTNNKYNTPIAICVIPDVYENLKNGDESEEGVHTARFVSLNYMNYNTPTTGNKDTQTMYFGNYGTMIGNTKEGTDETSYVGGKWNTKRCVFKAKNERKKDGEPKEVAKLLNREDIEKDYSIDKFCGPFCQYRNICRKWVGGISDNEI